MSAGGAAAGDFDAATAELKVLAEEIRDRSDLMIRVGLGTAEDEAAYSEALEALEEIELRALRREEARHAVWLRGIGEELRLARLFGTRPEIYRKGLSVRQKAVLIRRLGREGYLSLPFSMGDRRGAL